MREVSQPGVDYDNDGSLDLFLATRRVKDAQKYTDGHPRQSARPIETFLHTIAMPISKHMKRKVKGTHFLFKNTGNGNHWIKIKLVGKKSNRDGFGAKVLVRTSGMTQYQEAGVIGKMLFAQNNVPLHFGLGSARIVEEIEVAWPSGRKQVLSSISTNQTIRVEEPAE